MVLSLSAKAGKIALKEVQRYESKRPTSKGQVQVSHISSGQQEQAPVLETSWDDIEKVSHLGTGAFSNVYKVTVRHSKLVLDKTYALKCLKDSPKEKESSNGNSSSHKQSQFVAGAVDLALEAKVLSELQHENIIRLVAVPTGCISEAFAQKGGFFIVLELLEETLHDRLHSWGNGKLTSISMLGINTGTSTSSVVAILERMESTVLGIAKAMSHLHQHGIVLRDLKPDNVGFSAASGTVKLFDFGLARPVDSVQGYSSEFAGSLRYMAPEAVLARGTFLSSDVYSFGVLLWQICTLQKPFKKYAKVSKFKEKVVLGKYRPSTSLHGLHGLYSLQLSKLIEQCWDFEPEARPTFAKILDELKTIIVELKGKTMEELKTPIVKVSNILLKGGQKQYPSFHHSSFGRAISRAGSVDLGLSTTNSGNFGRMPKLKRTVSLHRDTSSGERHCVGHNTISKMQESTETEEASGGKPVRRRWRSNSMGTCACGKISFFSPGRPSHRRDCEDYRSETSDNDGMSDMMSESPSCDDSVKSTPSRTKSAGSFGGFKFWNGLLSFPSSSSRPLKRITARDDEDENDDSAIFDTPLAQTSIEGITP